MKSKRIEVKVEPPEAEAGATPEAAPSEAARAEAAPTGLEPAPAPAPERAEFEALRLERDALRDQYLRKRAELENYRKRVERDRHQAAQEATAALMKGLLPTLDNLDKALEAGGDDEAFKEGLALIRRELLGSLEERGLVVQDPKGQPFDPETHQALSHEIVPGVPDGTVVEVFRKGYFFKDRLLRPALVKVSKGPDASLGSAGGEKVH